MPTEISAIKRQNWIEEILRGALGNFGRQEGTDGSGMSPAISAVRGHRWVHGDVAAVHSVIMDVKGALTDPEDIIAVPWHWLSRQHRWGMEMLEPCQATLANGGHRWIKKMVQWYRTRQPFWMPRGYI
jgi:hypothetical protein